MPILNYLYFIDLFNILHMFDTCHIIFIGKYYIIDAGYGNRRGFIGPYRGTRYHLKEYEPQALALGTPSELFNLRHAKLRNVIERTFGLWKASRPQTQTLPRPDLGEREIGI